MFYIIFAGVEKNNNSAVSYNRNLRKVAVSIKNSDCNDNRSTTFILLCNEKTYKFK
jgi:hypothetical protein